MTPASRKARELTSAVWPKEDSTRIGRLVLRASSVARLVLTPSGPMPS